MSIYSLMGTSTSVNLVNPYYITIHDMGMIIWGNIVVRKKRIKSGAKKRNTVVRR
ncbi:hypothetical protein ABIE66_000499 [Peribacillus sp. B2I2]|uniref:hypothetical protein n=1 Tax=Peribacillus sp. B2I2 TaxID=3156468 RepID=UPI0035171F56